MKIARLLVPVLAVALSMARIGHAQPPQPSGAKQGVVVAPSPALERPASRRGAVGGPAKKTAAVSGNSGLRVKH